MVLQGYTEIGFFLKLLKIITCNPWTYKLWLEKSNCNTNQEGQTKYSYKHYFDSEKRIHFNQLHPNANYNLSTKSPFSQIMCKVYIFAH